MRIMRFRRSRRNASYCAWIKALYENSKEVLIIKNVVVHETGSRKVQSREVAFSRIIMREEEELKEATRTNLEEEHLSVPNAWEW